VKRRAVVGVMGSGDEAQPQDTVTAFALGQAIAKEGWVLLSGGRKSGVMEAVNEGAKNADRNALTIGILPGKDKKQLSDCVDVGIVTGMDNARNNISILSSDVVIACGYGGPGTASEIALALKSGKPVILLNERRECIDFFRAISGKLVHESNSVDDTISHVKKLLAKV
jgi:uncharacterized protein (TIGR00725 family)